MQFQADTVNYDPCDDEYVAYVFFSGRGAQREHYLVLNRCLQPGNESDAFVELDDQSQCARGGVAGFELHRNRLTLLLEQDASRCLGLAGETHISVDFVVDDEFFRGLNGALRSILKGADPARGSETP